MSPQPRALIFGEALVDVFPDSEVIGGAPLNVAVHLARAGWQVHLLSRVGEDPRGIAVRDLLLREGVRLDLLQEGGGPTGWVSVETSPSGEPSYVIHEGVAWDRIEWPEALPEVDLFYFDTLAARSPVSGGTLARLLEADLPWPVFDVNLRQQFWSPEQVREGCGRARLVKLNEDEYATLGPALGAGEDPRGIFPTFPDLELLCLTRGGEGAELFSRAGGHFQVGVPEVEVVDTVGAGDSFLASLTRTLVEGGSPQEALEAGAAAAAVVVQHRGALG